MAQLRIIPRSEWLAKPISLPSADMRLPATQVFMGQWIMPGGCAVEGCDRARFRREWCGMHYARWRRYGDPLHQERKLTMGPPEVRFWAKVSVGAPDECWPWTASVFKDRYGYGKFNCVNPSHLHLGTQLDNMREMVARGRDQWTQGTRGRADNQPE